jgi:3-methyladenine DNA glycosylase/8-oxoguanine DNA glycosylase
MPPLAVLSARAPPRRLPDPPPRSPPVLRLPVTPPVTWGPALRALAAHGVPGIEETDVAGGRHTGSVPGEHGAARVTVTLVDGADHVPCAISPADPADLPAVTAAVRRWLDLDHDPGPVDAHLATDPRLAPLVAARPGLRVVGSTDPWETAATTVLGQQVSVAAARTFAGRVVAAYGRRPATGEAAAFPAPSVLAAVDPADLAATVGLTGARARTVHAVATAVADGLPLGPGADPDAVRARLLALPGIGPWTVEYLALRALGDRDACPASDLVLRRALGGVSAREVTATAEAWRPWRAYAVTHLWTAAAYAG